MTDREQLAAVLVVDAAHRVVAEIAPDELEVFDGVVAGWRERPVGIARQRPVPGSSIGFGIDTALVSDVALQAVAAAVSEVLVLGLTGIGAEIRAGWQRRRTRVRVTGATATADGQQPEAAEPTVGSGSAAAGVAGGATADPTPVAAQLGLTESQVEQLRAACRRHALALGLSAESADLLADATVGAVVAPGPR
ncbi:hypothetical protein BDK92_6767 [Micromonospora pisi]|uniref:Uncharacterized protein n=1 Tax=Micromonospora pisi TaxID=589240 RepID=A0A495JW10_9ACTN|nr:hypothetical protein [Micromonospora pisi]RKR92329.1 hypothetical protein BDK92_6767 [Micromonospora pisi]